MSAPVPQPDAPLPNAGGTTVFPQASVPVTPTSAAEQNYVAPKTTVYTNNTNTDPESGSQTTVLTPVTPGAVPPPVPLTSLTSANTAPTAPPVPVPVTPTPTTAQYALGSHLASFGATLGAPPATPPGTPPPGWDAQTYASFKAANPGLEPTAQDTAQMQAAGKGTSSGNSLQAILASILNLNTKLGTKGAETDAIDQQEGIDQKTQASTDAANNYNARSQYYNDAIAKVQSQNPNGLDAAGVQEQVDQLTRQKNSELADIAIQKSAADGDLTTAQTLATAKINAEFEPIQSEIDNLKDYYSLAQNDMSESEKEEAQAAITAKQDAVNFQQQEQLAQYNEQIKQADPLYQAQTREANASADATANPSDGIATDITKQNALQNAADQQTQNSNYQTILAITQKVGATPATFTADDAKKLSNADQISIGKALARIQNPDLARGGGDPGNALSAVGLPAVVGEGIHQFFTGQQYDPQKVVDAVQTATSLYNQRNGITPTAPASASQGPPAGTDGTAYGFPNYHSDGTQWVPN